jgi:hypothetical protein
MRRNRPLQVTLDSPTQFAVEALASRERRSVSNLCALLIHEALSERSIELPAPRPHAPHGGKA